MLLEKVKRPGGTFTYELAPVADDAHGAWLLGPVGAPWTAPAPHGRGTLPFPVLVLLAPDRPWVAWWVDDPDDRRLEIDVCLPPTRTARGWRYVDLELDPIRHQDGTVEIEDEDELAEALARGWMSPADGDLAVRVAHDMADTLRRWDAPWCSDGWSRLA